MLKLRFNKTGSDMQDQQDAWGIESGSHQRLDVSHNDDRWSIQMATI
jgi:hypothetical protein